MSFPRLALPQRLTGEIEGCKSRDSYLASEDGAFAATLAAPSTWLSRLERSCLIFVKLTEVSGRAGRQERLPAF